MDGTKIVGIGLVMCACAIVFLGIAIFSNSPETEIVAKIDCSYETAVSPNTQSPIIEEQTEEQTEDNYSISSIEVYNVSQVFLTKKLEHPLEGVVGVFDVLVEVKPGEYKLWSLRAESYDFGICYLCKEVIIRCHEEDIQPTLTKVNFKVPINEFFGTYRDCWKVYIDLPENTLIEGKEYKYTTSGMNKKIYEGRVQDVFLC